LSTLATSSNEIIGVVHLFHPDVEVDFFFVNYFHFELKVILDWEAFIFALVYSS
jgi:hypothetical protein